MASFEFPDPKYEHEQALQGLLAQSIETGTIIRDAGFDREAEQLRLQTLVEVTNRAYTAARMLGLQAITEGRLSRIALGRIMGVHQSTVADWIKQAKGTPEHDYAKEPLHARSPVYLADRESA
jgi:hypothetical protein